MQLTVNGESHSLPGGMTLKSLLEHFQIAPASVVIELNHQVPAKAEWEHVALKEGDKVEIVKFMGGG